MNSQGLDSMFRILSMAHTRKESVKRIDLNEIDRKELEKRAKSYTSQVKDSLRARIILLKAQNMTQEQIRSELNVSRRTVMKWVNRFDEQGIEGLDDAPGRGRKPWISDEINNRIITEATRPPENRSPWCSFITSAPKMERFPHYPIL